MSLCPLRSPPAVIPARGAAAREESRILYGGLQCHCSAHGPVLSDFLHANHGLMAQTSNHAGQWKSCEEKDRDSSVRHEGAVIQWMRDPPQHLSVRLGSYLDGDASNRMAEALGTKGH
jgi:hypothetical protein